MMASVGNTLSKFERLSGKKSISSLLAGGKWGSYGHFRYCWLVQTPASASVMADPIGHPFGRILISVPKRYFKRAVKRNLLKRRIREAYRIRKICGADIMFQYNSPELASFAEISADVEAILARITAEISARTTAEPSDNTASGISANSEAPAKTPVDSSEK